MSAQSFQIGDVIARRSGKHDYLYVVLGWTTRGKLRLLRSTTGTEMTTWWHSPDQLPKSYRLANFGASRPSDLQPAA